MLRFKLCRYVLGIIIACTFNDSLAQNRAIQFESGTWNEVVQKAKETNKPIFVDAYAVWCGPCKWMSANVFTNDTVADFYNSNFINVKMDMEKGEGIELAQKWQIRAFPTLLYFDANGELMHQVCGACKGALFIETGELALNPSKNFQFYQTQYQYGNRSHAFVREYLEALSLACINNSIVLNDFLETQKEEDLLLSENWKLILYMLDDYNSSSFQYLESNWKKFSELYGEKEVTDKLIAVYDRYLSEPLFGKNIEEFEKRKEEMTKKNSKLANQVILQNIISMYSQKKDWKNYIASVDQYILKYPDVSWMDLNAYAWNGFENIKDVKLIKKLIPWIEKSIAIDENTFNLDTYAHLLDAIGKTKEAIKAQEKVVKIATEEGSEDVTIFQEYLNSLKNK